jgi:hypothetical protein
MRASTLHRPHGAPTSPQRGMPVHGSLRPVDERDSSRDRSPEGEHRDQRSPGSLRRLARLAPAVLLFLMLLLAAGLLLTGDSPVDDQVAPGPAVQFG